MVKYSLIIPALNEQARIQACILRVRALSSQVEIIVADGGSQDDTVKLAREAGVEVVHSPSGRGPQCNAGASCARGEILIFLHADTTLPPNALELLDRWFQSSQVQVGTFRLAFAEQHPLLPFFAWFARFDSVLTRFGDQGIVVRRSLFERLTGFPDWPLFEDVGFLQTARRHTRIHSFPATVTTSARRYLENGVIRQQLTNLWLMALYLSGVSPYELAERYERRPSSHRWS